MWIDRIYHRAFTGNPRGRDIKVNFLIAGTQKGGTTALDTYLRAHPEVCMSRTKEVHFFDNETLFRAKHTNYTIYHSSFEPQPSAKLLGESTPIYMYWYPAPRRIWDYNPEMKFIVLLRNPIERAFSNWNMEWGRGAERLSFWDAIKREKERCREALPLQHTVYSYIDRGFYTEQLRRIWHYFPRHRTLILKQEDLWLDPKETLGKVCGFLEIENHYQSIEPKVINSHSYVASLGSKEIEFLLDIFEYEIRGLERLLGWDCTRWLDILTGPIQKNLS